MKEERLAGQKGVRNFSLSSSSMRIHTEPLAGSARSGPPASYSTRPKSSKR